MGYRQAIFRKMDAQHTRAKRFVARTETRMAVHRASFAGCATIATRGFTGTKGIGFPGVRATLDLVGSTCGETISAADAVEMDWGACAGRCRRVSYLDAALKNTHNFFMGLFFG